MDKKLIRKDILGIRNNLDVNIKKQKDNIIKEKFLKSIECNEAEKIFIYISYSSEIETKEIILELLKRKKRVYVPRTNTITKQMDAVEITSLDNLTKDKYGILEPKEEELSVNPNELDLVVFPGVAFDALGGRIGYGAGYYDRFMKKIIEIEKVKKIAFAYDFQVINKIPMENHDIYVDYIITNDNDYICNKK